MPNKPLDLYATGAPQQMQLQTPGQQQPVLPFAPAPAQPPTNDLLSALTAIAGLGLNIAGATSRAGAIGQGALQWSAKENAQSAENQRETQRVAELEKEAESQLKRAKEAGITGASFDAIRQLGINRRPDQMRQEIDRELSILRQRQQENKWDKQTFEAELNDRTANLTKDLLGDPRLRNALVAEQLGKLKPEALENESTLRTAVRGLRFENNRLFTSEKDVDDMMKLVREAKKTAKGGKDWVNFLTLGMLGENKAPQPVDSALAAVSGATSFDDIASRKQMLEELKKLKTSVRGTRPDSPKLRQMREQYSSLVAPQQQQAPTPPAAPAADPMAQLRELAKKGDAKAKAYLDSKKIAY